eukprot:TRINITY_DN13846_c0_g1_i1.p1 TRINITY_DN13846_c0_g1~~TRINITY_DN13846_c0_g1_i1.p1  ORF type:complete len:579 (+),score=153.43 TRINITY_DN13846_c0_g1_i1:223-1737(+)
MVEALDAVAGEASDLLAALFKGAAVDVAERGDGGGGEGEGDGVLSLIPYIHRVCRSTLDLQAVRARCSDPAQLKALLVEPEARFSPAVVTAARHWLEARGLGYLLMLLAGGTAVRVRRGEAPPPAAAGADARSVATGLTLKAFRKAPSEGGSDGGGDVVMGDADADASAAGAGGAAGARNVLSLCFDAPAPCDFSHAGWGARGAAADAAGYAVAASGDRLVLHSPVAPPVACAAGATITDVATAPDGYVFTAGVDGAARLWVGRAGGALLGPGRAELAPVAAYRHPGAPAALCVAVHPSAPSLFACGVAHGAANPGASFLTVWSTEHPAAPLRVLQGRCGSVAVPTAAAWYPSQAPCLASADALLRVWDVRARAAEALQFQYELPAGGGGGAHDASPCAALAFLSEHTLAAAVEPSTLLIFDLRKGVMDAVPLPGLPVAVSKHPSRPALAVGCTGVEGRPSAVAVYQPPAAGAAPLATYPLRGVHCAGVRWVSGGLILCGTALA